MDISASSLSALSEINFGPKTRQVNALHERIFFSATALGLLAVTFIGFAPSYFLRSYFDAPPVLTPVLHLHGGVFTGWLLLYLTQTTLIAADKRHIHRRLGVVGIVLAIAMVALTLIVMITRLQDGTLFTRLPIPPKVFLVNPFALLILFIGFVGSALYFRRQVAIHKRLMLLATMTVVLPAFGRIMGNLTSSGVIPPLGPAMQVVTSPMNLFLLALVIFDWLTLRRVHIATWLGGTAFIGVQLFCKWLGATAVWLAFANWLAG